MPAISTLHRAPCQHRPPQVVWQGQELRRSPGVQGVDVFGRIPQIIAAQAKIAAVLADNAPDWAADAGWGARLNLHVLPDMASIVIGKKGATVQTVQRESGANVRIGKEADANNLQLVQVCARPCRGGGSCDVPHLCLS